MKNLKIKHLVILVGVLAAAGFCINPYSIKSTIINSRFNWQNRDHLNCGSLYTHMGLISGDSRESAKVDNLQSASEKINCLLDAQKNCKKAYLTYTHTTWEDNYTVEYYRTSGQPDCSIVQDGYSGTLSGYSLLDKKTCSKLGTNSDPKSIEDFGYLDISACK